MRGGRQGQFSALRQPLPGFGFGAEPAFAGGGADLGEVVVAAVGEVIDLSL